MTRRPGVVDDTSTSGLAGAVDRAKRDDPLAAVTVVAPSGYAAVHFRRALGRRVEAGGRQGIANVAWTTPDGLAESLGAPVLAARGVRPVARPVDLEARRREAIASGGWLAAMTGHNRALAALVRACAEVRRCPADVVEGLARRPDRAGELAALVLRVRAHLRARGYADALDVGSAALEVARSHDSSAAVGPVVDAVGRPLAPVHRAILDAVRTETVAAGATEGFVLHLSDVRPCADPGEEARAAVRAVVADAEQGVALWTQAIFHPGGSMYARAIHQELASAGVGANGPALRHLDRTVAGTTLLALLELAPGDWARDQVVAWLAGAPIRDGVSAPRVPASRWDAVSAAAGVVRGPVQWRDRLEHLATNDPDRADDVAALGAFVAGLVARTESPGGSWTSYVRWATDLLDHYLDLEQRWPADERSGVAQVRDAVLALSQLDAVGGDDPAGQPDEATFRRMVRGILEETALEPPDEERHGFGDGVFVAPFPSAHGLRFESVALVGLADAVVPGWVGDDALLPEEVRRVDPSGGLRTRTARLEESRLDVEAAIASGAARRTATFPRADPRTGREHVQSRWLETLVSPETAWLPVVSFAAGVRAAHPPLSSAELELHAIDRWASDGGDPVTAPAAVATPRLATGISAVRARAGSEFTRFDGYVGADRVSPFDPEAPVSATRLETYAKCPRRFLFGRVLNVERRVYPEDLWRMEATDRGTLVHAILEDYLVERLRGAPRSLDRLLEIARTQLDDAEAGGLVGKPLLWRLDRAAIVRNLIRFHDEEGDLEPLAAEFPFGTDDDGAAPAVTVTLADGRAVNFKGMADRVDRTRSGQLVVSDYKTGRQAGLRALAKDPFAGGTLLQLPVYALAARSSFGKGGPVHARYWLLSDQRSAPCYHLVVTEEVEARFRELVGIIANAVDAGVFPGAPVGPSGERQFEPCRWCDFDTVCPSTRDRQWVRKEHAPEVAPARALFDATVPEELAGAVVRRFVDPNEVSP